MLAFNGAGLVIALVLLFTVHIASTSMRVGDVAGETVVAQQRVTYPDRLATDAKRRQAMNQVPVTYDFDASEARHLSAEAASFFNGVERIVTEQGKSLQRQKAIESMLPSDVSATALHQFYALSAAELPVVRQRSLQLLSEAEAWRYADNQKQTELLALLSSMPGGISLAQRTAIGEVLATFLAPTLKADLNATRRAQRAAAARIPLQYATMYPGQVVVRRGDLVTAAAAQQLAALGLEERHVGWKDVAAALLFTIVVVTMLFWYLHAFQGNVTTNGRLLLLVDACILLCAAAARLLTAGHVLLPLVLPVAAASTFAALLMAPEACIALSLAIALLAGWIVANSFELTVYYFLTGASGVLAIRQLRQIKQFIFAGMYIAAFALFAVLSFGLINRSFDASALQDYVLVSVANGFLSSTLALGGFAMLSGFFGVTTTLQLFELAQPNQPLLRRLTSRAPGTYNHSLIVSNMVEQAAEAIGANAPVARVMALYHDVGKTHNPHCFVENQLGIGNIHDEMEPEESARVIRGHVSQGLKLGRQYHLPRPVLDGIAEHHGTTVLTYFLHRALQRADGDYVNHAIFTYAGPKPQTKETALLMLADGCESTVRASPDHSADGIRATVRRIIQERIEQQQLDECPLTLRDIDRAHRAFCSVLIGLYHPRIEYPDQAEVVAQPKPAPTAIIQPGQTADGRAS